MESNKVKGESGKLKAFCVGLLCFGLCAFSFQPAKAQTFAEWFEQGKTQMKYLVVQIEALNAFQGSVMKGYRELKGDWSAIENWKNGEYALHIGYYDALSNVNPVVVSSTDNASVQSEQQSILDQFNGLSGLNGLTAEEQTYIGTVRQAVWSDCAKVLTDLQNVQTSGKLVMSDGERMQRVTKDADEIRDQYVFTCHFCTQVRLLAAQRNAERNEVQNLMPLYGNN